MSLDFKLVRVTFLHIARMSFHTCMSDFPHNHKRDPVCLDLNGLYNAYRRILANVRTYRGAVLIALQ
jgi:hypothetical protein